MVDVEVYHATTDYLWWLMFMVSVNVVDACSRLPPVRTDDNGGCWSLFMATTDYLWWLMFMVSVNVVGACSRLLRSRQMIMVDVEVHHATTDYLWWLMFMVSVNVVGACSRLLQSRQMMYIVCWIFHMQWADTILKFLIYFTGSIDDSCCNITQKYWRWLWMILSH